MDEYIYGVNEGKCLKKLPDNILERTIGFTKKEFNDKPEISFLKSKLPPSDINEIEDKIRKRFNFCGTKAVFKKRVRRRGAPKNPGLSNTKKRKLGLYTLHRRGLQYKDLVPLHHCWLDYMNNYLDLDNLQNLSQRSTLTGSVHDDLAGLLWKADYHGALLRVIRSRSSSLVGLQGIVLLETRGTFKLLGEDNVTRCIPKESCEFELKVGIYTVRFLGKNLMFKPSDRTIRKIKAWKDTL